MLDQYGGLVGLHRSELTMGSILVVCLAGAPVSVAVEADAGVTVSVAEAAFVLSLVCRGCCFVFCGPASLWRLVSASPPLI